MASSTASTATPLQHVFETRVEETKVPKGDINFLIMDYLVNEGYPSAAQKFALEANIQPRALVDCIQERVQIRNAIHSGDIQRAIESINELNSQILDSDPALHFSLLRLQLVELIRTCTATPNGDIAPALEFATTMLAPRAPTNPAFLEDLERTMALLIFPPENLVRPLADILDPKLRREVANSVNQAILSSQGAAREAKIRQLVRMRTWAEQKAREGKKIPQTLDLGLKLEDDHDYTEDSAMHDARDDTESM